MASHKSWKKLKETVKTITRKTTPCTFDERLERLKHAQRGWLNYFRLASIGVKLSELDGWLRNRLRYCIWTDWKKADRKRKNLIQMGIDPLMAYQWSRTRMGGWAAAQSPILTTTITVSRLKRRGYEPLLDYYSNLSH